MVLSAKVGKSHADDIDYEKSWITTEALEVSFDVVEELAVVCLRAWTRSMNWVWFVFSVSPVAAVTVLASQPTESLSKLQRSIPTKLLHDKTFISA